MTLVLEGRAGELRRQLVNSTNARAVHAAALACIEAAPALTDAEFDELRRAFRVQCTNLWPIACTPRERRR